MFDSLKFSRFDRLQGVFELKTNDAINVHRPPHHKLTVAQQSLVERLFTWKGERTECIDEEMMKRKLIKGMKRNSEAERDNEGGKKDRWDVGRKEGRKEGWKEGRKEGRIREGEQDK